jgi:glycosyltransferase involved in cell wall biosynthesis
MIIVLHATPLSKDYCKTLENYYQVDISYISAKCLRADGFIGALKKLFEIKAKKVVITYEYRNEEKIVPLLHIIAILICPFNVFVINKELKEKKRKLIKIIIDILLIGALFFKGNILIFQKKIKLKTLENSNPLIKEINKNFKNLLYINSDYWMGDTVGGSVGHISGVVNGLLNHNIKIDFASASGLMMVKSEARYIKLSEPKRLIFPLELNKYLHTYNIEKELLNKYLELTKPDVIYQRISVGDFIGVILSRKWGIPLIVEYNGSEVWISENWGKKLKYHQLALQAENMCLKHANLVVTISDVLREDLIKRGVNSEKIINYPNCVDQEIFNPNMYSSNLIQEKKKKLGIINDKLVITFVGTFGKWHGANVLAKAIKLLFNKLDLIQKKRIHFLFIGDGAGLNEVKATLSSLPKLSEFCTFTGLVKQNLAPEYLAISDILVSPHIHNDDGSKFFGSPTKIFEYMAMGKAIIASDLEQVGEILKPCVKLKEDNTNDINLSSSVAVLVQPGCESEIVSAINYLVENPEVIKIIGNNARNLVLSKFTWDIHVEKIINKIKNDIK